MFVCLHYFEIANFLSLYIRSLPRLCFCDLPCKTVLRGYVIANLAYYIIRQHLCLVHLSDSPFIDDLEHIVRCFDKTTKLRFSTAEEPEYIKFGSARDNDETCNIRFGQLKLTG